MTEFIKAFNFIFFRLRIINVPEIAYPSKNGNQNLFTANKYPAIFNNPFRSTTDI